MPPNEEAISALEQAFMDYVQRQDALALSSTIFSDDAEQRLQAGNLRTGPQDVDA